MKCRLLVELTTDRSAQFPDGKMPPGTVLDHPKAFWHVRLGTAEAADKECELKANRTPEQLAAARAAYPKVAAGIAPEDYPAFDAGLMTGYNPDGSFKPGPNVEENLDDEEADDEYDEYDE